MKKATPILKFNQGFTLIELMIVLIIIAILAGIAIPSYQSYARSAKAAAAQQEMQKLAEQLERHKSRNFSYKGFNPDYLYKDQNGVVISSFNTTAQTLTVPLSTTGGSPAYTLTIVDGMTGNPLLTDTLTATGQSWAIKAIPVNTGYDALLMTSAGLRCKAQYLVANDLTAINAYTGCGANAKNW